MIRDAQMLTLDILNYPNQNTHQVFTKDGLDFRATKDIDIILVIEALNSTFVKHFLNFRKEGKYKTKQKNSTNKAKKALMHLFCCLLLFIMHSIGKI